MTPPTLQKILADKQALRRKLAARPIADKLGMLDALRERALAIRETANGTGRPTRMDLAHPKGK